MMRLHVLLAALLALASVGVNAHGYLAIPKSRNWLHNSYYCPHCLNGGGVGATKTSSYPRTKHGICGDTDGGDAPHEAGGKFATGEITGTYEEGGLIHLATGVASYHRGMIEYRVCRYRAGSDSEERKALTEECLNENVLTQASVPDAQIPGSRYYYLGNSSEAGYWPAKLFHSTYQLPEGLVCDGKEWKCVLQMHWVTGNTCNDPNLIEDYRVRYLQECNDNLWPEEFWNCADIKIVPQGSDDVDTPDPDWPAFSPAMMETRSGRSFVDKGNGKRTENRKNNEKEKDRKEQERKERLRKERLRRERRRKRKEAEERRRRKREDQKN